MDNRTKLMIIGLLAFATSALAQSAAHLSNISTRGRVGLYDDCLIAGVIVSGDGNCSIVIRAIGPSLAAFGITDCLPDTKLELHDGDGNLIAFNDDWQSDANASTVQALGLAPGSPYEAALYQTLPAGHYTAIVRGYNDTTGVALIEVYDVTNAPAKRAQR